jgi:hypothetical protein
MAPVTSRRIQLTYETRDLGYGPESGTLYGRFTGESDTWGKYTFITDVGERYYFFEDEILECEPASLLGEKEATHA